MGTNWWLLSTGYTSTNGGASWEVAGSPSLSWQDVAGSADGTKLVAVYASDFLTGGIFTSTNSGATWTQTSAPTNGWYSVTSSADGTKLAAMMVDLLSPGGPIGPIYNSTNSGGTWIKTMQNFGWPTSLAAAADGTQLIAGKGEHGFPLGGQIFMSTDSGATWLVTSAPANAWNAVASSADGTHLAAGIGGISAAAITGPIFVSTDSGGTWSVSESPTNYWTSVASSADGCKLVATVNAGGIYTWQTVPAPRLRAGFSSGSLVVSWIVPSMNFTLEQAPDLSSGNWGPVPVSPSLNSATVQYQVILPRPTGTMFYRLVN